MATRDSTGDTERSEDRYVASENGDEREQSGWSVSITSSISRKIGVSKTAYRRRFQCNRYEGIRAEWSNKAANSTCGRADILFDCDLLVAATISRRISSELFRRPLMKDVTSRGRE